MFHPFNFSHYFVAGDSGGPLFLRDPATNKAICTYGLVSYGVENKPCGTPKYPTVAARVASYIGLFDLVNDKNTNYTTRVGSNEIAGSVKITGVESPVVEYSNNICSSLIFLHKLYIIVAFVQLFSI